MKIQIGFLITILYCTALHPSEKPMESPLSSIMQHAYDQAATIQNIHTDSMQQLLESLKTIARINDQELQFEGLLYGVHKSSSAFNQKLVKICARRVHCKRIGEFFMDDTERKEYIAAAYLGTPSAVKIFERLSPTSDASFLNYILDGERTITFIAEVMNVPDYEAPPSAPLRYVSIKTGRMETVLCDKLEQTLQKFPVLTVGFFKSYFKAMQQ